MKNQRGQGLIEYLIIVSVVAIGSIAIVRILGNTVYVRFANITNALQNNHETLETEKVEKNHYKKRALDDFFKE